MKKKSQSGELVANEKFGTPVYTTNPSIPAAGVPAKSRRVKIGDDRQGVVLDTSSGEILGQGGAFVYKFEEVDQERFVKLFLDGLKQATGLTKSGLALFEVVYNQVRENPNRDTVMLSLYQASQHIPGLARSTFYRGLKELLEKEFLYRTPDNNVFFVNIRYMFNGDRLAFVKAYQLKNNKKPPENAAALLEEENRRVG